MHGQSAGHLNERRGAGSRHGPPFPLLAVSFLASVGFSIVMPFLVFVVKDFGGNAFALGLIEAAFSAAQLVGAPLLGRLSDRRGRKRILFYSQLGGLAAWVCFFVALYVPKRELLPIDTAVTGSFILTLPLLLVLLSRSIDGLTNGSISVANAYVSDVTPEDDRKTGFGRLAAATSLGFVLGPAFAGSIAHSKGGTSLLVGIAMALSAGGAFVVYRFLPDVPASPAPRTSRSMTAAMHKALGGCPRECVAVEDEHPPLRSVLRVPGVLWMLAIYFLVYLGFSIFLAAFPFHALTILEWSPERLGIFYTALAVALVVTQGLLLPALGRSISAGWLATAGSLVLAAGYATIVTKSAGAAWAVAVLYGVGNGLMWPSFLSLYSRTGPSSIQGTLQGIGAGTGSLASIVGTLGGGALFGKIGAWTFVVPSAVLLLTALALVHVSSPIRVTRAS